MTVVWIAFADEMPPLGQRVMLTGRIEDHALPHDTCVGTDDFEQVALEEPRTYRRWLAHGSARVAKWPHFPECVDANGRALPVPDYWCRIQSPDTLGWGR